MAVGGEHKRLSEKLNIPEVMEATRAVSYTHLDVYKRQVLYSVK